MRIRFAGPIEGGGLRLSVQIGAWIAIAFLLRFALLPLASGPPIGDSAAYLQLARSMIDGQGYIRPKYPIDLQAWYPPLYPLLLAVTGALTPLKVLLFNFAIDVLTAAAILRLASSLKMKGELAAAAYLLWPTAILMAPIANKEVLSTLLVVLMLTSWIRRKTIAFGVFAGLSALTQPALALLPCFFVLFIRHPGWVRSSMIAAGVAGLVLLPWWVRNWLIFGQFVPLTTSSGAGLWVGSMGDGINWHRYPREFYSTEIGLSKALAADAFQRIAANPVDYLQHTLTKAQTLLWGDAWGAKPLAWMNPDHRPSIWQGKVPNYLSLGVTWLALLLSIFGSTPLAKAVRACFLYLLIVVVWFQFSERHHYFMVPLMLLLVFEAARRLLAFAVASATRSAHAK